MPSDEPKPEPTPTLWTAPAPTGKAPAPEAKLDPTVTSKRIEEALKEADKRSAAFAKPITDEMLSKRY